MKIIGYSDTNENQKIAMQKDLWFMFQSNNNFEYELLSKILGQTRNWCRKLQDIEQQQLEKRQEGSKEIKVERKKENMTQEGKEIC